MKSAFLAAAVLLSATMAFGQTAQPQAIKPPLVKPHPKTAAVHAAKQQDILDITQIVGVRQVDPATYEIDAKLHDGSLVDLRMNAFVMQDLGRQLGTYGHQ